MAKNLQTAPTGKKKKGCLFGCLTLIVIIVVFFSGLEIFRRYVIVKTIDKDAFKPYERTSEITDIAQTIPFTDKARDFFYKIEPRLVDAPDFIKFCKTVARGVESLACFANKPYGGPFTDKTIFLLQITDPRFTDHKYSAAAHEFLHLAYKKLGSEEKTRLNSLLKQELSKHMDDTHLNTILKEMNRVGKDNSEITEELHSKFAVEYRDISPELEEYYTEYFSDRKKIVDLYIKGGFNSRIRRIDQLNGEIKVLNGQLAAIQNSGDTDKYNSLVGEHNAKVSEAGKLYAEVQEFYAYFNPDYVLPEKK